MLQNTVPQADKSSGGRNGYQYFRDNSITEQDVFVNKPDTSCFLAEKINLHLKNIRRITYKIDSFILAVLQRFII